MADVHKSVLINYSAEQMYELVTAVADYPQFLPWCRDVVIITQNETTLEARIHVSFKGIQSFFHTRNAQHRPHTIEMAFVDGPFRSFYGSWRFIPLTSQACKIEFHLHYAFSNFILEKVIGPVFSVIANTFVDCFVKRADELYGQPE